MDYLELYHDVTSRFFGISILPVSDLLGGQYFGQNQNFGGNHFFPEKGGLGPSKRGPTPPFCGKKGATAPLLRKKGMVNTDKYRPIPT